MDDEEFYVRCDRCGRTSHDVHYWSHGWAEVKTDAFDWDLCPRCTGALVRECVRKQRRRGERARIDEAPDEWRLER